VKYPQEVTFPGAQRERRAAGARSRFPGVAPARHPQRLQDDSIGDAASQRGGHNPCIGSSVPGSKTDGLLVILVVT
jgi:hypothetical protein